MLKRELEQQVGVLEREVNKLIRELAEERRKSDSIPNFERTIRRLEGDKIYMEGQMEMLKRLSGLYPEEKPTREEYKEERGYIN